MEKMICTLKNNDLTVEINTFGAELKSIKDNASGTEYMWSGDAKYWGKTSPILFPLVGALKNGVYTYDGKTYPMSRHGFARDMEFRLEEQRENSATFVLEDTAETLQNYPFQFRFEIQYILEEKSLKVLWRVINRDCKTMYFSLGGHPAFACPLKTGGKRTDCFIWFDTENEIVTSDINFESGLINGVQKSVPLEQGYLPITEDLFAKDALVIENHQCHEVALCDENKKPYIKVSFDAPLVGVWSVPDNGASYVCIEPWYGRCDREEFDGKLQDREWGNSIEPEEMFEKEYVVFVY